MVAKGSHGAKSSPKGGFGDVVIPLDTKGKKNIDFVEKATLRNMLERRQMERAGCISLPFTVAFFFFFTMSVLWHEDIRKVHLIESAVRDFTEDYTFDVDQSRTLEGITEIKDFWRWGKEVFIPAFFQQADHLGNELPKHEWSRVLLKNEMRGGVLLEQFRSPDSDPPVGSNHNVSEACSSYFPGEGMVSLADSPFAAAESGRRLRLAAEVGGPQSIGAHERPTGPVGYPENTYPFFLFQQEPRSVIEKKLSCLEHKGWIDTDTREVAVRIILTNEEVGLLESITVRVSFLDTGGVYSSMIMHSFFLNTYSSWVPVFSDACFVALLLYIFVTELKEVINSFREGGLLDYFKDFWNCLDWATVIVGWIITGMFLHERISVNTFNQLLSNVKLQKFPDAEYWAQMYELHKVADEIGQMNSIGRLILSDYTLLVMLRFFKTFKAQPRLALVTSTVYSAGSDLIHFGIVFISVFLTFAFSAMVLFGRRLTDFSSFTKSLGTCFAIICGEFDWIQMRGQNELTTIIWFWSFMVIVFLVLLNMVLAIVMDVYTEVRANVLAADPIWVQAADLFRSLLLRLRTLRSGKKEKAAVCDEDLLEGLKKAGNKVTVKEMIRNTPGLDSEEAGRLLAEAITLEKRHENKGMSLTTAMKLIYKISGKMEELLHYNEDQLAEKRQRSLRLRFKFRRIIFTAFRSGELHQVAETLHNDDTSRQIREAEMERKLKKAAKLTTAGSEHHDYKQAGEQLKPVDSCPDSPVALKNPHWPTTEPSLPGESMTSIVHGLTEQNRTQADLSLKIVQEIQALRLELQRANMEHAQRLDFVVNEIRAIETLAPAIDHNLTAPPVASMGMRHTPQGIPATYADMEQSAAQAQPVFARTWPSQQQQRPSPIRSRTVATVPAAVKQAALQRTRIRNQRVEVPRSQNSSDPHAPPVEQQYHEAMGKQMMLPGTYQEMPPEVTHSHEDYSASSISPKPSRIEPVHSYVDSQMGEVPLTDMQHPLPVPGAMDGYVAYNSSTETRPESATGFRERVNYSVQPFPQTPAHQMGGIARTPARTPAHQMGSINAVPGRSARPRPISADARFVGVTPTQQQQQYWSPAGATPFAPLEQGGYTIFNPHSLDNANLPSRVSELS